MQVFLIRHPPPLIEAGVCYGRLDVDCVAPEPYADRLRAQLPAATPVISSPLRRARRLAQALDPRALCDERLCEIDFGAWEGRRWDDIERAAIDAWAADVIDFVPPGGESVAMLQARAIAFAAELAAPPCAERLAIITHAGIIRSLIGHWRGLPAAKWTQLRFDFGSITEIQI